MSKALFTIVVALIGSSCPPYSHTASGAKTENSISVHIKIQPDLGWKWNTAYPAKFNVEFEDGNATKDSTFMDGNISVELPPTSPTENLVVRVSFSLCTKTICKSFRNKVFNINFGEKE